MDKYRYASLTWEEVNEAVLARKVILVPVAAIEQHGPHLPIETDNIAVAYVCEQAAQRHSDFMLCAPTVHYGFNEHNMDFPGTITVRPEVFINYCYDVGESLARQGFERIVWVNGHGSNSPFLNIVARMVTNQTTALSAMVSYWDMARDKIVEVRQSGPGGMDHACEFETSLLLRLAPELVYRDRVRDEYAFAGGGPRWMYPDILSSSPVHFMNSWSRFSRSGVNGAPTLASAAKGEVILEAAIANLAQFAREFREMEVRPRVDHTVRAKPQTK